MPSSASSATACPAAERLIGILLAAIAVQSLTKIACALGLFADGSYYLLTILENRSVTTLVPSRWFAHAVTQGPLTLSLWVGLRDMSCLIYLHSFGLIAIPAALWILALWKLRTDAIFWSFFMTFCIVYLNSNIFAIGETNLAFALSAISMAVLLSAAPLSPWNGALLLMASMLSILSYEAFAFLGVLLAGVSALRLLSSVEKHPAELAWLSAAIFFFCCGSALSCWNILFPRDPAVLAHAASHFAALSNKQLVISVAIGALYFVRLRAGTRCRLDSLTLAAGLLLSLALLLPGTWASPTKYYESRASISFLLFLMLAGLTIQYWATRQAGRPVSGSTSGGYTAWVLPVALFVALSVPNVAHTLGFYNYLKVFHSEVSARTGIVPLEETRLVQGGVSRYGWGWTNPSLSLLLRSHPHQAIISSRAGYAGWQPFDAGKSPPALEGYRMNAGKLF